MTDLAQLRALLAKMTLPGKWQLSGVREKQAPQLGKDARFLKIGPDSDYVALVFFDMNTGLGHHDAAGIVALVNAAPALLASAAQAAELEAEVSKLRGAISWIEPPFVDATTSHDELKKRVNFCVADAKRAASENSHDHDHHRHAALHCAHCWAAGGVGAVDAGREGAQEMTFDNDEHGQCRHCGRDNRGHEQEPCADDCPQYWEVRDIPYPEHGEPV